MAVLQCKICGTDLHLPQDGAIRLCTHCGHSTIFKATDNEQRINDFNQGNQLRRNYEFDEAITVFSRIIQNNPADAEAYWCRLLCRFGVEYVEDTNGGPWRPVCHRASFDSILEAPDYLAAMEHATDEARSQYQADALCINEELQKILSDCPTTEPYDVFICYKETDEQGDRTQDSVKAQDIYYRLTEQGRRVFFARITLEKLPGIAYEPYIFAALNSAKVMIVLGSKPEYFNAVWVKNEWSRFYALKEQTRDRLLIPCYYEMDPYQLPEPLDECQAYDMTKIGFLQDLIHGINKVLDGDKAAPADTPAVNIDNLLKRVFLFLESGKWDEAQEYCTRILDAQPECAEAYVGQLMAKWKVHLRKDLQNCNGLFDEDDHFRNALRFGDQALQDELNGYINAVRERLYLKAVRAMETAKSEQEFKSAAQKFKALKTYKDAERLTTFCYGEATKARKEAMYQQALRLMQQDTLPTLRQALQIFQENPKWKESVQHIEFCRNRIADIEAQQQLAYQQAQQRKKKLLTTLVALVAAITAVILFVTTLVIPSIRYSHAVALAQSGDYTKAALAFGQLGNFKDSPEQSFAMWDKVAFRDVISVSKSHTIAITANGTIQATGGNDYGICDLSWTDIVAVCAARLLSVGLKADGTVVAQGYDNYDRCAIEDWTDIVAIDASYYHTVGLKKDGTIMVTDGLYLEPRDVAGWTDIIAISTSDYHLVGLKTDGTVIATGDEDDGQCNVDKWTDVVAIGTGKEHTVGLKVDGTVVATGRNYKGECNVRDWTNIVAISANDTHTVGLKADGTVVAVGSNSDGQCDVTAWTDIVAISAGATCTVGVKSDGTIVTAGVLGNDSDNYLDFWFS